jgi:hypothetical protein
MIAAVWIIAATALLLWSAGLWAIKWILTLPPADIERWQADVAVWPLARWLDDWWPGWLDLLAAAVEWAQWLLAGVSEWLQAALWFVWGSGALLMLLAAALLHAFVRACNAPRRAA